ncbi:hypothetical protein AND4_03554 [Vibrio sp. AND4]|nr:hypothetical protein AND4_03554 [Vibrio sp. AND4]
MTSRCRVQDIVIDSLFTESNQGKENKNGITTLANLFDEAMAGSWKSMFNGYDLNGVRLSQVRQQYIQKRPQ